MARAETRKWVLEQKIERPLVMPWCHFIDQHCAPDVAYLIDDPVPTSNVASKPFSALMGKIFGEVTGKNWRRGPLPDEKGGPGQATA